MQECCSWAALSKNYTTILETQSWCLWRRKSSTGAYGNKLGCKQASLCRRSRPTGYLAWHFRQVLHRGLLWYVYSEARGVRAALQASESVDAVVSLGMLSGLASHAQRQLAASVARVLKPGGVFLFVERGGQPWSPCSCCCLPAAQATRRSSLLTAQATLGEPHPWCRRLCSLQAREWVRACPCPQPLLALHAVTVVTCPAVAQRSVLLPASCATSVRCVFLTTLIATGREALDAMLSLPDFEDASYDVALAGVDAHAIGLARKARTTNGGKDQSRATSAGRQRAPKGFA